MKKRTLVPTLMTALALSGAFLGRPVPAGAEKSCPERPCLLGIALCPPRVHGGEKVQLKLALSRPAPAGGVTITLAHDPPEALPLPERIVIPAGVRLLEVTLATPAVKTETAVALTATQAGIARNGSLTLTP